jgi:hypothetical protein
MLRKKDFTDSMSGLFRSNPQLHRPAAHPLNNQYRDAGEGEIVLQEFCDLFPTHPANIAA